MKDREKVIKGMEQFRADLKPFCGNHADWERFDAGLSMLKEQEPVTPHVDGEGNYCCESCDTVVGWEELTSAGLTPYVYKFCPECGREVKWE